MTGECTSPGGCVPVRRFAQWVRKKNGTGRIVPVARRCLSWVECARCGRKLTNHE